MFIGSRLNNIFFDNVTLQQLPNNSYLTNTIHLPTFFNCGLTTNSQIVTLVSLVNNYFFKEKENTNEKRVPSNHY